MAAEFNTTGVVSPAAMPGAVHNGSNGGGTNGHHPPAPASAPAAGEETFVLPASREQTRYWMLAQLDPTSTASNMAIAFNLEGPVDDRAAEAAIAALTLRHEALRTIFRLEAGILSQVVLQRPLFHFTGEDLGSLEAEARQTAASDAVIRHGRTRIDLHTGPVLHAHLIHLSREQHILALTMNHIVCDGWSNGILIRDFTLLYEALRKQQEPVLPELPFQFADFSLWQNEYLESDAAREASVFWKSHITADLSALDMPTDQPRQAGRSFPGHIESALLPKAIDDRLKAYCRTTGSTKHIVLLAAFEALCARITGQQEFLLGSTIANRTQPGMEDVVGRFANPQIIVARVDGDPTFAELEQRVRDWETAAYNHQDLPFSRIIEDFQMDQAGATSQFLQVWFLYQKAFMQPQQGEGLRVVPRRSVSGGVDFDLLVSIVERAEGPRIQMEYNTQLFAPGRIQGWIADLTQLLDEALLDPSLPLSRLAHTPADAPEPGTAALLTIQAVADDLTAPVPSIADRVRTHAQSIPGETAIADAARSLSWTELNERSDALAAALTTATEDPAAAIAIVLTPQVESAIALLAALKTGRPVLPLPAHAERAAVLPLLQHAARNLDLAPMILLAPKAFTPAMPFEDFFELPAYTGAPPALGPSSDLLIVTNAVEASITILPSADLAATLTAACKAIQLHPGDSILALPTESPLDAVLDLFLPLSAGAQLSFAVPDAAEGEAEKLCAQLAHAQATHLLLGTRGLRQLSQAAWPGDRRVTLLVRGERLPAAPTLAIPVLPRHRKAIFELLTAPLGAALFAVRDLSSAGNASAGNASAGNASAGNGFLPLPGTALAVTNTAGQPLPPGAFGELRTSSGDPVGQMARCSAEGHFDILEAPERYVQLRGHRVCLADLEHALLSLPLVCDARAEVLPAEDRAKTSGEATGAHRLVLYLVPSRATDQNTAAVRQHLAANLPSHLLPSDCIWVDRLPHSLDGRVATGLLPRHETVVQTAKPVSTAQLNGVEEKLADIWKDVLGLKQVDLHAPFFDLGGSSLLLVRLFARINKAFDTSLPITTIFDARTIAELARMLGGKNEISPLVHVQSSGSRPPLFMVHSYLLYKGLSTSLGADQPFYGLRELDSDGHLTIADRVKRYVSEIRRVQPAGPYHLAGWCAAGPLTVEVARQLMQAEQEVSYLALFDSWLPGYLDKIEDQGADYKAVSSKLAFHRAKMRGLPVTRKIRYLWLATGRLAKEAQYRIYLRNWDRLRKLSEKYNFALPQFMHNTSLDTFSALKDYREQQLPVRLTLIRASDSREVRGATISCGWERVAQSGVDVVWAPGDHETMFVGENLKATAAIVQQGLADAAAALHAKGSTIPGTAAELLPSQIRGTTLHVDCAST